MSMMSGVFSAVGGAQTLLDLTHTLFWERWQGRSPTQNLEGGGGGGKYFLGEQNFRS